MATQKVAGLVRKEKRTKWGKEAVNVVQCLVCPQFLANSFFCGPTSCQFSLKVVLSQSCSLC